VVALELSRQDLVPTVSTRQIPTSSIEAATVAVAVWWAPSWLQREELRRVPPTDVVACFFFFSLIIFASEFCVFINLLLSFLFFLAHNFFCNLFFKTLLSNFFS
jgi:hypothetical protein